MANRLKLTREQLAKFLPDSESIKQFERLFSIVDEIAPKVVEEVAIQAGDADARSIQALDVIEAISQLAELAALNPPRTQAQKSQEVLAWLSM